MVLPKFSLDTAFAVAVRVCAIILLPASLHASVRQAPGGFVYSSANEGQQPSKLDYLLLASLADANGLFSVAAYSKPVAETAGARP